MRYALTFTSDPNAYDWGDTDTIIFTVPRQVGDLTRAEEDRLVENVLCAYGKNWKEARDIAESDNWFMRNVDDIDVTM